MTPERDILVRSRARPDYGLGHVLRKDNQVGEQDIWFVRWRDGNLDGHHQDDLILASPLEHLAEQAE